MRGSGVGSVSQSVMEVWGLGSRSIVSSVWQLLLRPGYFICDYIGGSNHPLIRQQVTGYS